MTTAAAMVRPDGAAAARRAARWGAGIAVLLVSCTVLAWSMRAALLTEAASVLVVQDPVAPTQMIVVSSANAAEGAIDAAEFYRRGLVRQVVLTAGYRKPFEQELQRLGVSYLASHELARQILERSGVPADAIEVLPDPVDGTGAEIAAVAALARQRRVESVLYVTLRSHTARARWLLERQLPTDTRVTVRSSRYDTFDPTSWWRHRDQSREVLHEYLHWVHVLTVGDAWNQ